MYCGRRTGAAIARTTDRLGGDCDAYTTKEWMAVHASYHELLRFALAHKFAAAYKQKPPDIEPPTAADREFLDQLRAAPGGRVVPLVRSAIARVLAREVADVIALLEA